MALKILMGECHSLSAQGVYYLKRKEWALVYNPEEETDQEVSSLQGHVAPYLYVWKVRGKKLAAFRVGYGHSHKSKIPCREAGQMKACLLVSGAGLHTGHMVRINIVCWVLAMCQTYDTIPSWEQQTDERFKHKMGQHTGWVSLRGEQLQRVAASTVSLIVRFGGVLHFFFKTNNQKKTIINLPWCSGRGKGLFSSLLCWAFTHLPCDCAYSIAYQLASHLPLSPKAKLPPRSCFSYIPTVVLSKKVIAGAWVFILILPQMTFIHFRPRHTSS